MVSEIYWSIFGLTPIGIGYLRWFFQLKKTHKNKKVIMPLIWWYGGLANSIILMIYSVHRIEPVFFIGSLSMFGINIYNIRMEKKDKEMKK